MSIATIITKYNNFTDKNLDGRDWFVCDHCHRIMAFGMPEADFAVSGFDDHGEVVDFCDIECAEKAGYEMCGDCNMWFLPSEMSDMKCSDGTPMCKSCAAENKKDVEESKMKNVYEDAYYKILNGEIPGYVPPTDEEVEWLLDSGWTEDEARKGYAVCNYDGTGLFGIECLENMGCDNDTACAIHANENGIPIIPINELPENFEMRWYGWIDTPENRANIKKYCGIEDTKNESEEKKMENQNQIDIIGCHIVKLANEFNHTLVSDNYATDDERNEDTHYYDDVLMACIWLIKELGYTIKFKERECGNPYYWNEYVKFDLTNTVTGETKTFYCDCPTRKYKVTITNVIECEACNKDEAERIAKEKMNLDLCSDYETECCVEERR